MSEKIIVVSMAKNEEDIIESFVRYYMTFVDGMIIVDHNSEDDTGKILNELKREYSSLVVEYLDTVEYAQYIVMTSLMDKAANEMGADWILPLDIDEYLIPKNGVDCRSLIRGIKDNVVSVDWVDHELIDTEHDRDKFLLSRLCNRSLKPNAMSKIIVKGNFVRNNSVRLVQGNHGLVTKADNGVEDYISASRNTSLILAHYPHRSKEQFVSKNAIGWLTTSLKYSSATTMSVHWKRAFDAICANDIAVPKIQDSKFVGKLYEDDIKLIYTDSGPINVIPRVLKLAEKVCDMYAREYSLNRISPITVIMPLGKDFEAVADTIGSLLSQTLDKWKLIILAPDDLDESVRNALTECDGRIKVVGLNDDVSPEGYVKFISPGRKLAPECLAMEAVALYNHNDFNLTYSNGKDAAGADVVANSVSAQPGIDIWNAIKDQPYSLTGGISGIMLRKLPQELKFSKVIENYMWKEKEILGILLQDNLMFVFPDRLV